MSFFSKVFNRKPRAVKSPGELYNGLRLMVMTKRPPGLNSDGFQAVVMDMGQPNGTATVVAVADGTVSLYTSTGGGIIGLGQHEGPRKVAVSLLEFAPKFVGYCQSTTEYPLPASGNVRFYLVGAAKTVTAEGKASDFGSGSHVLSPLFFKFQELLTEMRKVDEKLKATRPARPPQLQ